MTDRVRYLTVVLDKEYRDDDVGSLMQAMLHMRGVLEVKLNVTSPADYANRAAARNDLRQKLVDVLWPDG